MSESPYARARAGADAGLRAELLDVAGGLLASEGPAALTMRRVAAASGCSTTVLYRLFMSKDGIVRGLYREGFDRLRERLEQVAAASEPPERLAHLAAAYRQHALAHPDYYAVMFARPVPQFIPSEEDVAHGRRSLAVLVDAVADAQAAGQLADAPPDHVAQVLWTAAHGAVSLELAGHLTADEADRVYAAVTSAAVLPFLSG